MWIAMYKKYFMKQSTLKSKETNDDNFQMICSIRYILSTPSTAAFCPSVSTSFSSLEKFVYLFYTFIAIQPYASNCLIEFAKKIRIYEYNRVTKLASIVSPWASVIQSSRV